MHDSAYPFSCPFPSVSHKPYMYALQYIYIQIRVPCPVSHFPFPISHCLYSQLQDVIKTVKHIVVKSTHLEHQYQHQRLFPSPPFVSLLPLSPNPQKLHISSPLILSKKTLHMISFPIQKIPQIMSQIISHRNILILNLNQINRRRR